MSFGVSNLSGANGALAGSGLSGNGAVAAQNFLNALLGQEQAPRSGGAAFLADVQETKDPEQKRALIDGFAEGFAAASGSEKTEEAGPSAESTSASSAGGADAGGAEAAGGEGEGAGPSELMSGFQEIADRVAESDLPKDAKNTLLDGIAALMSKLQSGAPQGATSPSAEGSPSASPNSAASPSAAADSSGSAEDTGANTGVWSHEVKDGEATIQLGDRYTVKANEKDATWTVTNNETGQTTKISGDPHVDANNDGLNDFDFKKNMTFQLEDGTKITVGTVPGGANETTFSSSLTITNGDKAVQVTGLGDTHDGANNLEVKQSDAGSTLDDLENDGATTIYEKGGSWRTKDGKAVDQSIIDASEAAAA